MTMSDTQYAALECVACGEALQTRRGKVEVPQEVAGGEVYHSGCRGEQ